MAENLSEKCQLRLPAHLCSFREGQLSSQSSQAIERVLYARQGKLKTVFLQIPIAPPTNRRQVLRLPIPIITIQIIHGQTIAPPVGIFRPRAIFTPILSTHFCKFGHPLKQIQPSLIPRLEETVYLLLGGQPLHTNFPGSELTRLGVAFYVPMRPSAIPGGFAHCDQFGYFRFFGHCNTGLKEPVLGQAGYQHCLFHSDASRIPAPPVLRRCKPDTSTACSTAV